MGATTRYLSTADTAKLVREALKKAFPGVRFSVRSGGGAVDVRWTDGPVQTAVAAVVERFKSADFDGRTDSTTYRPPTVVNGEPVEFGAEFVSADRSLSPEFRAQLLAIAEQTLGEPVDESKWYDQVRGQYVTEYGTWKSATGYNLLVWLAEHVPASR